MRPSCCCDANRLGRGGPGCDAVLRPLENLDRLPIGLRLADRRDLNRVALRQVRLRHLDLLRRLDHLRMVGEGGRHAGGRTASGASRYSVWLCR